MLLSISSLEKPITKSLSEYVSHLSFYLLGYYTSFLNWTFVAFNFSKGVLPSHIDYKNLKCSSGGSQMCYILTNGQNNALFVCWKPGAAIDMSKSVFVFRVNWLRELVSLRSCYLRAKGYDSVQGHNVWSLLKDVLTFALFRIGIGSIGLIYC